MSFKSVFHKSKLVYSKSFYQRGAKIAFFLFQNQNSIIFYFFFKKIHCHFLEKLIFAG